MIRSIVLRHLRRALTCGNSRISIHSMLTSASLAYEQDLLHLWRRQEGDIALPSPASKICQCMDGGPSISED